MKKSFYLLAVVAALFSCTEKKADYILLSGNLKNSEKEISVFSKNSQFSKKIVLKDGLFSDTLHVEPGSYFIFDGKNMISLYLEKGSHIKINADSNDFSRTAKVSGKGSEMTRFYVLKNKLIDEKTGDQEKFYMLAENEFKAKANELKNILEKNLDTVQGISEELKALERNNINYGYLFNLISYQESYRFFTQKPEFKVSPGFKKELSTLKLDNEKDYAYSDQYKRLVADHYAPHIENLITKDSLEYEMAVLKVYNTIPNEFIRNEMLFTSAKSGITYAKDTEEFYKYFQKLSTNSSQKKIVTEVYNKLMLVSKGKPSPKFINYTNFAGGTTSLDDLKGKYIYIDVWATWCGPCKGEIPFLQKVEEKYHSRNIAFVSISVDKAADVEKWRKMVKDMKLGGIQLMADKNFGSQFITDYMINGIPRFILLDPQGNIISSNAPRPSEKALTALFDEYKI